MKAKHVFTALGLAFVMGAGVVAGIATNRNIKPVKAAVDRTVYCAIDTTTLGSYTLKLNCNVGDNNTWVQTDMVDLNDTTTYAGKKVFSGTFSERYGGVDAMQFQLYDGSSWHAQDQVISSWTTSGNYADKLHVYGGAANSWETYSALPTHTYSYSINNGTYVDMVDHTGGEVKSPSAVSLAEGDILTFQKDDVDLAVGGKRNSKVVNDSSYELRVIADGSETLYLDTTTDELWAGQYSISDGYYVAGTMTNWVDTRFLIPMTATDGVYKSATFSASVDDKLKIVQVTNNAVADSDWLGVKDSIVHTATEAHAEYDSTSTNVKITDNGQYYVQFTASEIDNGYVPYHVENPNYVPDIPAEDGYYICGEFSSVPSWKYNGATKMTNTTGENVAYEMNFLLAVGDQLRVRSYFTDRPNGQAADQWAELGDNGYAHETTGWGKKTGDNFEATVAGYYDVYAKYENDAFMFYVAPHVDTYQIDLSAVLYEGKQVAGVQALDYQLAYAGSNFTPSFPSINGYVGYKIFEDSDCLTEYTPKQYNAAGQLYLQYMREGYYVAGDATFSGSVNAAWNVEGATRLSDTNLNDPANMLEGTVVIPEGASTENPVLVKPMRFSSNNQHQWLYFQLGATYSFASIESEQGNLAFTKGGTYAVYVKMVNDVPTVWLNEGIDAFNTKFLTDVGGVCNGILNGSKDLDNLKAVWLDVKAAYESLSADEKAEYTALTINDGNENGSDLEKVIAKYSYIVHKYGTSNCEDFIWGQTYAAQSNGFNVINNNNIMLITVISLSIVAISAAGLFFIIRRKRLVK